MNQAPADIPQGLGFSLSHDHNIGDQAKSPQRAPQADRLLRRVIDRRLDHQEVEIAARTCIAAGVGAEQDHASLRCRLGQAWPPLSNQRLVEHATTVTQASQYSKVVLEPSSSGPVPRDGGPSRWSARGGAPGFHSRFRSDQVSPQPARSDWKITLRQPPLLTA